MKCACWLGVIVLLGFGSAFCASSRPGVADLPPSVKRAVFLGDSITYSGGYVNAIATYFATRHPGRPLEIINVGLSSETTSGLSEDGHAKGQFPRPDVHERLTRVLQETKPDLVFACYGMNDGIYLPLSEERFGKFKSGVTRLHDQVVAAGARIVHVTPPVFDEVGGKKPGYNAVLAHYSRWLVAQRRGAKWDVIDIQTPMQEFLDTRRKSDPEFFLAKDGVHPGEIGHWLIAREILRHLGARDIDPAMSAEEMVAKFPHGPKVHALVSQKTLLLRDAWLTATRHKRPGVKDGLPLPEAQAKANEIDRQLSSL